MDLKQITSFEIKIVFFEWTIWTQLPETALANQSELWGEPESLGPDGLQSGGQSPVNVRESPSQMAKTEDDMFPSSDGYRFSKFFPHVPFPQVPMAWWSSCRCTRKAIHNQILGLISNGDWRAVEIQPEKIIIWFNFPHSRPFLGLRFWVQFPKNREGGSDMALWYEDMKGPRWTERWSYVFPDPKWGATWAHNPQPINVSIRRSMRFKELEPSNLGSAPKNHANLHVIFSIQVEIALSPPKTSGSHLLWHGSCLRAIFVWQMTSRDILAEGCQDFEDVTWNTNYKPVIAK